MSAAFITLFTGLVILGSHLLEGITGFGCTVIALPFLSLAISIKTAIPILCVTGFLMALYIVLSSYRYLRWKEFFFIAIHVALGMPLGMVLFDRLPAEGLCIILALFMIAVGANGARRCIREKGLQTVETAPPSPGGKKTILMRLILFGAGIIQGSLGSGGPLVVIYAAGALPEKSSFRVTLSMLWLVMNFWRLADWTLRGSTWNMEIGRYTLTALPFVVVGVLIGDYLHRRVNAFVFRLCVYGVLTVAGILMLIKNITALG